MKYITGGVCAPKGFRASGVSCGIRKNKNKLDLGIIVSDVLANSAAIYTQNIIKGAPINVTKAHLENCKAQVMLCNSGIANTCAADGQEIAEKMCQICSASLGLEQADVIVASTGIIGVSLPIENIIRGLPPLVEKLSVLGNDLFSQAIMTTDTFDKQVAVSFKCAGVICHIGACAKGSGMINPNMATMLSFITTDVAIDGTLLEEALKDVAADSYNMLSVDGDTSTNDMVAIMANGQANNQAITVKDENYAIFKEALLAISLNLTQKLAKDGEGATKCLQCKVSGTKTKNEARLLAKAVIGSPLVKSAMFAADANWGRILCALGYAQVVFEPTDVAVSFCSTAGEIKVCSQGMGLVVDEKFATKVLSEADIAINIEFSSGSQSATAWGCDLTYDYVKINGSYRT
ncbi:MAG: bifunctional glutamate N-acetyltransferase/amino-acid acetyltransferase ArgJ [Culicoidibacterales bacterium]